MQREPWEPIVKTFHSLLPSTQCVLSGGNKTAIHLVAREMQMEMSIFLKRN